LLFKLIMRWHLNHLQGAFISWSKVSEHERVRKRQLVRVFGKIKNRKTSIAFNTWYHTTSEMERHDLKCIQKGWMGWLGYIQRRHRLKWLLLKIGGGSIKDLAGESLRIWHLIAHKRADQERFEKSLNEARTHIAHLEARSTGLAHRFHHHHHKHFSKSSIAKIFPAWVQIVEDSKRRLKTVDRYASKREFRFLRRAYNSWNKVIKDKVRRSEERRQRAA